MSHRFSIPVSVALLAAFLVFNVGMPVYFYLCPMMSDESPICDVSPSAASNGISFTAKTPSCCAKVFVADRKTTPFLKAADQTLQNDQVLAVIPVLLSSLHNTVSMRVDVTPSTTESPPPLYILNSVFLI